MWLQDRFSAFVLRFGMIFAVNLLTPGSENMKTSLYLILMLFVFTSCVKNEDPIVTITSSEWYLERIYDNGGSVHLKIMGASNADKVTIKTFGDGDISDRTLELNSKKQFDEDIIISFSITAVPSYEFVINTELKAYKNNSMLQVPLTSGKLKY